MMRRVVFLFTLIISLGRCANIEYLGGLEVNEECVLNKNGLGICQRIEDCLSEFDEYKNRNKSLTVCSYGQVTRDSIICCPKMPKKISFVPSFSLDYNQCRDKFLKFRKYEHHPLKSQTSSDEGVVFGIFEAYADKASLGGWPSIAAVGWTQPNRKIEYRCGGAIIGEKFILTAAHCTKYKHKSPDTVRVGDRYLHTTEDDEYAQQLNVRKIVVHPKYKSSETYNDIAIIFTMEEITFSRYVAPICVNSSFNEENELDTAFYSAGYGETEEFNGSANKLLETSGNIVRRDECNKVYEDHPQLKLGILDSQICIRGHKVGEGKYQDSCQGDSGGPIKKDTKFFVTGSHNQHTYTIPILVGLVSFGVQCGLGVPSGNTNVAYYRYWIESVVKNEF